MHGLRGKRAYICLEHAMPGKRDCVVCGVISQEGKEIIGNGILEKQDQFVCLLELMLWFNTELIS